MKTARPSRLLMLAAFAAAVLPVSGDRPGYSREEFARRRAALMERTGTGFVVLFGDVAAAPGTHFRQDNDFFYIAGVEDEGAIAVLLPGSRRSVLFLPRQTERQEMIDGPNLLKDPDAPAKTGFDEIHPVAYFDEFVARSMGRAGAVFHLRLSPRDSLDEARSETGLFYGRRAQSHYNDQISLDNHRVAKLRERYPQAVLHDLAPHLDSLRAIKTAEEIAVLRRNGRLSAEAVAAAMLATRPGLFEYEIEAAALHVIFRGGARGPAFAPIVGSGPNTCVWHYDENDRRVEDGDLVLMDFGADLGHMAMDITRTWPANGRFTPAQREIYAAVLAVQTACIEAYRPGATARDVQDHVDQVMRRLGLDPRGLRGGFGHGVGLATHDVPLGGALAEGMVFAIEPALYIPETNTGIRIEDTVLITRDGCEVLTRDVPKEIDAIERLLAGRR